MITPTDTPPIAAPHLPTITSAVLTIYQFFDIGDAIDLDQAQRCLSNPSERRVRLRTRQSESIRIAQPPLRIDLGSVPVTLADEQRIGALRAVVYDLGAVEIAIEIRLTTPLSWENVADLFAAAQELPAEMTERIAAVLDDLEALIRPAISRPQRSTVVEDYCVLIVERLAPPCNVAELSDHPAVRAALLGERRTLSADASRLVTALSYYSDDLALLSWNGALLIESDAAAAATAVDILAFANVELLLIRSYDAALDARLPEVHRRIAQAQRRFTMPIVRRYSQLLSDVQRLVAEVTEVTEQIDNALKVTDDVYWNRLYSAALSVLRVRVWRDGVDHKLALLRETYAMLHADADSERAAALEWAIVLLIVFEIVMALLGK
ncbi:conserved hypothetical protein [Roseiflexus castenholzii DSM 13941]|jgi:hypothetical protein|uniref:DUF155 domain-containing protein n=2 Tax=Roseiflexus castenholzii TaxID=120962 RepID=A7NFD8_ROSCS|nr:conserved hypothetical protein [Roseiflexus castenholzii DSM 13941]